MAFDFGGVERAVGLIDQIVGRQNAAAAQMQRLVEVGALRSDDADGLSWHAVPENKNPVGRKRELGGSRFSGIYKRPQSELKSARLKGFQRLQTIPSRHRKVNETRRLCPFDAGRQVC